MFHRVWMFLAIAGLIVFAGTGCAPPSVDEAPKSEQAQASEEAAQTAKEFGEGKEARAWMAAADHSFFKVSKEPVAKLVADMYAAGAQEVRITAISEMEELKRSVGGAVVVQLPKDAAKRKSVFDAVNAERKEMDDDPDKDTGQEFVEFVLD